MLITLLDCKRALVTRHISINITWVTRIHDYILARISFKITLLNPCKSTYSNFRCRIRTVRPSQFSMISCLSSPSKECFDELLQWHEIGCINL